VSVCGLYDQTFLLPPTPHPKKCFGEIEWTIFVAVILSSVYVVLWVDTDWTEEHTVFLFRVSAF